MFETVNTRARVCPDVPGLPHRIRLDLKRLFQVWMEKLPRNIMRSRYYYGHEALKNLGIAVNDDFADVETVVGWPAKAVDSLANRCRLDSFIGAPEAMAVLKEVVDANDFYARYEMLVPSELTHSVAAFTVTGGEIPILHPHSAISAAMLWSYERNRVKCGITVARVDENGRPVAYNLYEDDAVYFIYRIDGDHDPWGFEVFPHAMGRPLIVPLVYSPSLDRPFGTSRITREVMTITDSAMRTALRSEIGAEFFTSPQKALLGAPDALFSRPVDALDEEDDEAAEDMQPVASRLDPRTAWEFYIGHVLVMGRDEEGNLPNLVQLNASSMQPHTDYMRSLAARFSGATDVPISELGIVQDNPSSAEAISAAKEPLIKQANKFNKTNERSLITIGQMAVAIAMNKPLSALTDDERAIRCHFMDPDRPSTGALSDAMTKQAAAAPQIVKTRVYWEKLGYTDAQIDEILTAIQRGEGESVLANIFNAAN